MIINLYCPICGKEIDQISEKDESNPPLDDSGIWPLRRQTGIGYCNECKVIRFKYIGYYTDDEEK